MRSPFASLRSLVLPAGATSGQRIVINGVTGRIEVYDASNVLRGLLQPASPEFSVYDAAGALLAAIADTPAASSGIVRVEIPTASPTSLGLSIAQQGDAGYRLAVRGDGVLVFDDGDNTGGSAVRITRTGLSLVVSEDFAWKGAAYDNYTPAWEAVTTNPTLGNGTAFGRYKLYGAMCHTYGYILRGSTSTNGTGNYRIGLPVTPSLNERSARIPKGPAWFRDDSLSDDYQGFCVINTTGDFFNVRGLEGSSSGALWNPTGPVTFAQDDAIGWNFVYERDIP